MDKDTVFNTIYDMAMEYLQSYKLLLEEQSNIQYELLDKYIKSVIVKTNDTEISNEELNEILYKTLLFSVACSKASQNLQRKIQREQIVNEGK